MSRSVAENAGMSPPVPAAFPVIACGNMKNPSRLMPFVAAEESGRGIAIVERDV